MDAQSAARLILLLCLASSPLLMLSAHGENVLMQANGLESSLISDPLLFVFGASMVDSGTNAVAMPFRSNSDFYPYGSDYFGKPVGRWSNGRTFMDILTQSLGVGLLDPFIKSFASNFAHGVNFASSGSTAQNTSSCDTDGLFSLLVQIDQFREYQSTLLSLQQDSRKKLELLEKFSNSIYFFETAQNDYLIAGIESNQQEVVKLVIAAMRQAFEVLYDVGARNFLVMNVTPLGCTPSCLTMATNMTKDAYNCISAMNEFVSLHNKILGELLSDLRIDYPLAKWIIFDAYSIFLDGYQNPSKYGMKYPFQACCGSGGGSYNFNTQVVCGKDGVYINGTYMIAKKCKDPSLHLIWDSIHPVESFSKFVAQAILNNTHLIPKFNILERFKNARVQ